MSNISITKTGRGFHIYGDPILCTYGTTVRVYESSAASGPHVWLAVECDPDVLTQQARGEGTAHLNPEQAKALIARLQAWLDEIPTRWSDQDE